MPERKGHPTRKANKDSGSVIRKFPGNSSVLEGLGGGGGTPDGKTLRVSGAASEIFKGNHLRGGFGGSRNAGGYV